MPDLAAARVRVSVLALFVLGLCLAASGCGRGGPSASSSLRAESGSKALAPAEPRALSATLRKVRARGRLICGVNAGRAGFALQDSVGVWRGFDVDLCRAVAAAVLGDARQVRFVALDERSRFAALKSEAVDLLARNTSVTFVHDAAFGLDFAGISYYDSQGFLAPRSRGLKGVADLARQKICVVAGSNSQLALADYFKSRKLAYQPVPADTDDEARDSFAKGGCTALTGDVSYLASARSTLGDPAENVIMKDMIAKDPLGPMVREGDGGWEDIVRWTLNALILADEYAITSANVEQMRRTSPDAQVRRLLGAEGGYGRLLALSDDWAFRTIRQVGNYGEIFDRNVGANSPLRLERGLNALWSAPSPGLLYASPMQ